jgi:uncharacterized membrane protein
MKQMGRWESFLLVFGLVGLGDSIYLLANTLFPSLKLYCPNSGIINCSEVTSSPFSHVYGVPVALLAVLWFASLLVLGSWKPSFYPYLMMPLWIAGVVMIGYLIIAEILFIHAICIYCTLAHACALLLGIPVAKLTFREQ